MRPGARLQPAVFRAGVALAIFLLLPGCMTVGPDYAEPDVAWLDEWETELYGQLAPPEARAVADLRFWWELFDDPVLNELVVTARRENLSLQLAGLRILEARAAAGIADSTRYPQVQQLGGSAASVTTGETGGGNTDSFGDFGLSFDIGWELDFWGRFRRSIESADAAFFASIANQQYVQVLLSAQVADLYYAYLSFHQRIEIARSNAEIQRRSYEITEELYNSGQDSELDLQQARTQYLSTLSSIPSLEISLVNVRNALALLLGRAPGDLPELMQAPADLPLVEPILISDMPANLIARRPDVRAGAWAVAAQSAQIGVAKADYYPAISLLGSLGLSANTLSGSRDTTSLVAGSAFSWNVFDYGRIANNVRLQDARLQQVIIGYQSTVLGAAREIDDAAIGVVKTHERKRILLESVAAAQRSLEIARTRYREGYADFQRVLDAQRTLFSQTERELINRSNHVASVVALYKAMGGGWLEMPIDEIVPDAVREEMKSRSNWGELLDAPLPTGRERPVE
jgi:NodT family efflux transporter outer membrane factor (OMF) lipoprotein